MKIERLLTAIDFRSGIVDAIPLKQRTSIMRSIVFLIVLCVIGGHAIAQDATFDIDDDKTWPALARRDRRVSILDDDSKLTIAMKKRHNACLHELRTRFGFCVQGDSRLEALCGNLDRFVASHRDLGLSPTGDLALQKERLALAKSLQHHAATNRKKRNSTELSINVNFLKYYVLHTETELLQLMESQEER